MNHTDSEMLKLIRDSLVTGETRLFDHVSTTFRWLMATMFAANGGAIIGLLGWTDASKHGGYSALLWFAAGLVLSILMGALSAIWGLLAIFPMARDRLAIETALRTETLPEKQTFDNMVARNTLTWKTWVPSYAGGASLLCLVIGMFVIGCHL